MRADFHVHCSERSHCGRSTAEAQVQAAISAQLDIIAFTDHGRLMPAEEIARLNAKYDRCLVMGEIELRIGNDDVIVLGINDPMIAAEPWEYPRLHAFVTARGGFMAVAHPFRYGPEISLPIRDFPPHALEIGSINTPRDAAGRIADLARSLDLSVLCNSDAHATASLGRHYNTFDVVARSESAVLDVLRRKAFTAVTLDEDGTTRQFVTRRATRAVKEGR